ncbi:MAG TPA: cbb3-type cytochrome c oxidase subunit II [Gammaproteobacteria bacterium]|nr:cbb3-type cytochrome c oxidase subunit II [Gammaproteobacteria bacterium]
MKALILIAGGSTLVYAILAVLMGVLPGIELSKTPPGPGVEPLTPLEAEGRDVYVANGCSYCHTQQVRPLPEDRPFGRPIAAGDLAYQTPELLGSERNGPDLSNIGNRQPSKVWQYMHLYDPRSVQPQSIMPDFSFLFRVVSEAPPGVTAIPVPKPYAPAQGVVIPTHKAVALVAYLLSLKQPPIPGYVPPAAPAPSAAPAAGGAPAAAPAFDAAEGAQLFSQNCAVCHQANGEGITGVFPPLKGNAVVLAADPTQQIHVILEGLHGANVGGSVYPGQMPSFKSVLSDSQIANIIDHERTSWGNNSPLATPAEVAAERAKLQH